MSFRGRASYVNLSRYSELTEKTCRRWFGKRLDFIEFNQLGLSEVIPSSADLIAVIDASFVAKSGDKTQGLGRFYNSKAGKAEKGLEISTLAVVDVTYNTAYHLSTRQTLPKVKGSKESRVDDYLQHFQADCHVLPKTIRYLVTDAYYSQQRFTQGVLACDYQHTGKLRSDANLRYLYTGEQKAKGRSKRYDGKLRVGDISRLVFIGECDDGKLYSAVVNCVILKRDIRIVSLCKKNKTGIAYTLLFSTDTDINPLTLYRYYKARFQIECLFRDAKQFTGLCDCQARSDSSLHSHFNACFTALNLIKWHDRQLSPNRKPISVSSWKNRFFNQLLIERIYANSAIDLSSIKSSPLYQQLCNFGVVSW